MYNYRKEHPFPATLTPRYRREDMVSTIHHHEYNHREKISRNSGILPVSNAPEDLAIPSVLGIIAGFPPIVAVKTFSFKWAINGYRALIIVLWLIEQITLVNIYWNYFTNDSIWLFPFGNMVLSGFLTGFMYFYGIYRGGRIQKAMRAVADIEMPPNKVRNLVIGTIVKGIICLAFYVFMAYYMATNELDTVASLWRFVHSFASEMTLWSIHAVLMSVIQRLVHEIERFNEDLSKMTSLPKEAVEELTIRYQKLVLLIENADTAVSPLTFPVIARTSLMLVASVTTVAIQEARTWELWCQEIARNFISLLGNILSGSESTKIAAQMDILFLRFNRLSIENPDTPYPILFLLQRPDAPKGFTGYGVFTLNSSFIVTLYSSIVTFLLVLFQMQPELKEKLFNKAPTIVAQLASNASATTLGLLSSATSAAVSSTMGTTEST